MCSHGSDSCSGSQRLVSRVKVVYEFILSRPRHQTLISLRRRRQATWLFAALLSVHFWLSISLTSFNNVRIYNCEFSSYKWLLMLKLRIQSWWFASSNCSDGMTLMGYHSRPPQFTTNLFFCTVLTNHNLLTLATTLANRISWHSPTQVILLIPCNQTVHWAL